MTGIIFLHLVKTAMKLHICIIAFLMFILTSCNNFSHAPDDVQPDTIRQLTSPLSKEDSAGMMMAIKYNDALAQLDSLTGERINWENKFPAEASAIDSLKQSIRLELKKETLDSNKVNSLIAALNKEANDLIMHLKQEKK